MEHAVLSCSLISLPQIRKQKWDVGNMVLIGLRIPSNEGNFLTVRGSVTTRGPTSCVMRPVAIYIYILKNYTTIRQSSVSL